MKIGATAAASRFSGKIESFLDEYLISEEGSGLIPFGGRDSELDRLDCWLNDKDGPARFIVTAPAGRGKSTLLVHWLRRLEAAARIGEGEDRWQLAFVPISMLFDTNRPEIFYEALAARLADIVGHHLDPPRTGPAAYYEDQCRVLLGQVLKQELRILLVVDGIDEALGGRFEASWFPRVPGRYTRLLLSARLQIGDRDSQGWLARLGWKAGVRAESLDLLPLRQQGVENLLKRTGTPVDELAVRPDVIQRLLDLTQGEPLLLRFYVEDLWKLGESASRLTLDDLEHMRPGFRHYFDNWLERQRWAWVDEGGKVDENVLHAYLAVLACAYGRLSADELAEVARRAHSLPPFLRTESILHPIRRFVMGTGRLSRTDGGYVLSHPKLGDFIRDEYFHSDTIIERTRRAFADWGLEVVAHINSDTRAAPSVSPYLLKHLSLHLKDISAPNAAFMALVEQGWLRAWELFEGGYQGFSQDIKRAEEELVKGQTSVDGPCWARRLRCKLMLSSIASIGSRMSGELLIGAFQSGALQAHQALHWLSYKSDSERADGLISIAPHLSEELLHEATRSASEITDRSYRVRALAGIAQHLPPAERAAVIGEAVRSALSVSDSAARAFSLIEILALLPEGEERDRTLGQALQAARAIRSGRGYKARALIQIALHLPKGRSRSKLFRDALKIATVMPGESERAVVLAELAPHLTGALLEKAGLAAAEIGSRRYRVRALAGLAPYLPEAQRAAAIRNALDVAAMSGDDGARSHALVTLAPHLPEALLGQAFQIAAAVGDEWACSRSLVALASRLPEELLAQAFQTAATLSNEWARSQALVALAPRLPEALFTEVVQTTVAINHVGPRAVALAALAANLPRQPRCAALLRDALRTAVRIATMERSASALIALAPHLTEESQHNAPLAEAMRASMAIGDDHSYGRALIELAPRLPPAEKEAAIREALRATINLPNEHERATLLAEIAPRLSETLLRKALQAVPAIGNDFARAKVLIALAPCLQSPHRAAAFAEALRTALSLPRGRVKADILVALAPQLAGRMRTAALAEAQRTLSHVWGAGLRAEVLANLAPHLSENERAVMFTDALSVVAHLEDEERLHALISLAPHIPKFLVGKAQRAAAAIGDEMMRAWALASLMPHLQEDDRNAIRADLRLAIAMHRNEWDHVKALAGFAPYLKGRERVIALRTSLQVAGAINDATAQAEILAQLAPQLPDELIGKALELVITMRNSRAGALALAALAPRLPQTRLGEALSAVAAIGDSEDRAWALGELAPYLSGPLRDDALSQFLLTADGLPRPALLRSLPGFYTAVAETEGMVGLCEIYRGLRDSAEWFP